MNKDLFNSAAKWALVLGLLMSCSRVYETKVLISGELSQFAWLTFEWLGSVAAYFYIIYLASKRRGDLVMAEHPEVGYSVRNIINYSVTISAMAAVIVGVTSHIYVVNEIGGYGEYAQLSADSLMKVISEVDVSQDMTEFYASSTETIRQSGENPPSIFSTTISMVANYIIAGFAVGGIIGLFTKRLPQQPDNNDQNEQSNEQ